MRRLPRSALAVVATLLVACSSGGSSVTPWSPDVPGLPPADSGLPDTRDTLPVDADRDPGPVDAGIDTDGGGCSSSDSCPLGTVCVDGRCDPGCRLDRDCPEGLHCKPDALPHGFCIECTADAHCTAGRCVDGQCRTACTVQGECAAVADAPVCDPFVGVCVGCLTDPDCPTTKVCVAKSCRDGCRGDGGCPTPLVCDTAALPYGACVACTFDGQCPGGRLCLDHQCVFDCTRITCPFDRPRCVADTGDCVECTTTAECGPGHACLGNACVDGCLADADCGADLHCTPGSPGQCVTCTSDDHCVSPARCVGDLCVYDACTGDGDCGAGRFCHPVLKACYDLPNPACKANTDCGLIPGTQIGRNCDPLTRTCIPDCLPGSLCLDPSLHCIDGSCYACRANADCPGTRCDPYGRTCAKCTADADCLIAGWHCNEASGACAQCVFDADCGPGRRCHPDKHRCVECMINADCKVATLPTCGKDNRCMAACTDDCTAGSAQCAPTPAGTQGLRTCADIDNDPCLDLGPVTACPAGQVCLATPSGGSAGGGGATCTCDAGCPVGQARCPVAGTGAREECVKDDATGCSTWKSVPCDAGAACSEGACVCTGECSYGDRKCNPDKSWVTVFCGRENKPCNHWFEVECPFPGYCSEGQCTGTGGGGG